MHPGFPQYDMAANESLLRSNAITKFKYQCLKEKQIEVLNKCESNDVICILPTGYGKTIIIQCLPFLTPLSRVVLVINPLNAIIEEQSSRFAGHCIVVNAELIKAICGAESSDQAKVDIQKLKNGDVTYILGHPEHMTDPAVKKIFMSEPLATRISHIVVEEAHCVLSWGKSQFRPAFLKLCQLRAMIPNANMLALTATATKNAIIEITQTLCMKKTAIVAESPNRPNIFLSVKDRPSSTGLGHLVEESYESVLDPVLAKLKDDFKRTIVYLPLKWYGSIHKRAITHFLGSKIHEYPHLVAQYHAPQTEQLKSCISSDLQKSDGQVRLLIATEAYGMGADSPNIHQIIHVGPPNTLETYTQEIGRCGRDGTQSTATIFMNKTDLASKHLNKTMKEYCLTSSCRRQFMLQYFNFNMDQGSSKHNCCDNCLKNCSCENCISGSFHQVEISEIAKNKCKISKAKIACAESMLRKYFNAENSIQTSMCVSAMKTGLSDHLINILLNDISIYASEDSLKRNFPDLERHYIVNISAILSKVINLAI